VSVAVVINQNLLHMRKDVNNMFCIRDLVIDLKHVGNTGAEPTTSDFTVVTHGDTYQAVEGIVLVTDQKQQFSALEKYGQVTGQLKHIHIIPCGNVLSPRVDHCLMLYCIF